MVTDNYKIEFKINDTWEEHELVFNDFKLNEVLYKGLRSADSSCSITLIPDVAFLNKLRTLNGNDVEVRIFKNEELYFSGYLRKTFQIKKAQSLKPIKMEIVNPSFRLKRKINESINYTNQTVSQILVDLITRAGITNYILPTINSIIPGLFIEKGKETYHKYIDEMLFEYGYIVDFDITGKLITYSIKPDSLVTTKEFNGSNCYNEIEPVKKEEEKEYIIVDWIATKNLANTVVFSDTTSAQNGYKCYIELPPNGYLGGEVEWFAELDSPEGEILSVTGLTLDIIKDADIHVLSFAPQGNKVLVSVKNTNSSVSKFIRKFDIKAASATVRLEGDNKSIVINKPGTEKISETKTEYLYEKTSGDNLAQILAWYYRYSDFTYKVSSYTNWGLGDVVSITENGIGSNTARIISKKTNEMTGLIEYELDAIDEYTPAVVTNEYSFKPVTPNALVDSIQTVTEAGLNEDGTLAQPINSNTMVTDITPTGDGLYLTKSYIGLRKDGDWKSYIANDGTFSFKGDTDNFIQWNGTKLQIKGEMILDGNSTITGKITSGNGLESSNYSAGLTGWKINGIGDGEFNDVIVRGKIVANNTSEVQGTISTGAIKSNTYVAGTSGFSLNSTGDVEFNNATVRGIIIASGGSIGGMTLNTTEFKSTNYSVGSAGFLINNTGFAEFNNINVRGEVNSTSGAVGGWSITTDKLVSNITGARIELNKGKNRVSIMNTSGVEKVVMGYLEGLAKNVGSGTYSSSDYGFWVAPGDTIQVDGPMKILNGDMTASDSSFVVLSGVNEVLRLGSDSGAQGLHLYSSSKKKSITPVADAIRLSTPSGYVEIGPLNTGWCHFNTDRAAFYFYKNTTINGTITTSGGSINGALSAQSLTLSGNIEMTDDGSNRNIKIQQAPAVNAGRFLFVSAGDAGIDATPRSLNGGTLVLQGGKSRGSWGSYITFQVSEPAGAAGLTHNTPITKMTIGPEGVNPTNGTGPDTNNVYIRSGLNVLKERTIQSGVWSYNYNQHLNTTSDVTFGKITTGTTATRSSGVYGVYDSTKTSHIWSMGTAYTIPDTGANFGNLYGLAYKHTNNTTGGTMASGHQAVWCQNGTGTAAIGTNIWTSGSFITNGTIGRTDDTDLINLVSQNNVTINGALNVSTTTDIPLTVKSTNANYTGVVIEEQVTADPNKKYLALQVYTANASLAVRRNYAVVSGGGLLMLNANKISFCNNSQVDSDALGYWDSTGLVVKGAVNAQNIRIPISTPSTLTNGDIWMV